MPGFGFVEADGSFSGFDTDFCRAVAAAVLGDSEAVDFVPLTAEVRLTAYLWDGVILFPIVQLYRFWGGCEWQRLLARVKQRA